MICKISVQLWPNGAKVDHDLNRDDTLISVITTLCQKLGVTTDPSSYCLQVSETKHTFEEGDFQRSDVILNNGTLLLLKLKSNIAVQNSIQQLKDSNINNKKKAIFDLKVLLKDSSFAFEFIKQQGISLIIGVVSEATGNTLAYGLTSLQEVLSYNQGIENLPLNFIQKIISLLENTNLNVCRSALDILQVLSNNDKLNTFKIIYNTIVPTTINNNTNVVEKTALNQIITLLGISDVNIQSSSLALLNNLIISSGNNNNNNNNNVSNGTNNSNNNGENEVLINLLNKLGIEGVIKKNCVTSDVEFKKQLSRYQRQRLKYLKYYRDIGYNKQNTEHEQLLMKLWTLTYPNVKLENRVSEQWKLLGFQGTDPATDFRGMGLLGLNNLIYFAENYTESFRKIVTVQAERKERDYPVAVAGINVTQLLCDLFHIYPSQQKQKEEENNYLYSVLFDHNRAFEEIYCITFRILDTTWDEMNASYMDFPKVIAAVRKRISDVINTNPLTIDQFQKAVTIIGATHNRKVNKDNNSDEDSLQTNNNNETINKLRDKIKNETQEIMKQQRNSILIEGMWFKSPKSTNKSKQFTFTYLKLMDNKQEFIIGTSTNTNQSESTMNLKITEISDMVIGSNTPMFSKQKKLTPQDEEIASLSFSFILKEAGKSIDCVAFTNDDFIVWTDAVRLLLNDRFEHKDTLNEITILTAIELKIRLLDIDEKTIPTVAPPVPKELPSDMLDF